MAGFVNAVIEVHSDRSYDVVPDVCPATDRPEGARTRCYTIMFDGARRACPYWTASTYIANSTERSDPTILAQHMRDLGANVLRCGVICQRQRANHRPGC